MATSQRRASGARAAGFVALALAALALLRGFGCLQASFVPAAASQQVVHQAARQIVPRNLPSAPPAVLAAAAAALASEPAMATDYDDRTASASLVLVGLCVLAGGILGGIWFVSTSSK
uniref:Uncharacterized protein n=1 Tax=Zooxanthella nutricula TaxID=1333877 RepID=A0A7S2L7R0_9DINO